MILYLNIKNTKLIKFVIKIHTNSLVRTNVYMAPVRIDGHKSINCSVFCFTQSAT